MTDNSRVRVSHRRRRHRRLFSALSRAPVVPPVGAEDSLRFQAVAREHASGRRPRRRAGGSSTATARAGRERGRRGRSRSTASSRQATRATRCIGQLAEAARAAVHGRAARARTQRPAPDRRSKPAIVALDVPERPRIAILEDPRTIPGQREEADGAPLPAGQLAAQVLGYVGEVTEEQTRARIATRLPSRATDRQGRRRARVRVELRGKPRRETVRSIRPAHRSVRRSRSSPARRQRREAHDRRRTAGVAEDSLAQGIASARDVQNENIKTRRFETFRRRPAPSSCSTRTTARSWRWRATRRTTPASWSAASVRRGVRRTTTTRGNYPLINRATQGSTRRARRSSWSRRSPMTHTASAASATTITDDGTVELGGPATVPATPARGARPVNLAGAHRLERHVLLHRRQRLLEIWDSGDNERLGLQTKARELGFGAPTGIELDEADGAIPTPSGSGNRATRTTTTRRSREQRLVPGRQHLLGGRPGRPAVTPLQLANAYAAFANGGTLWQPRIERGRAEREAEGRGSTVEAEGDPPARVRPDVRATIMAGFAGRGHRPEGTAPSVPGFPLDQIPSRARPGPRRSTDKGKGDTSLFAAIFAAKGKQYVVGRGRRSRPVSEPRPRRRSCAASSRR